MTLAAAILMCSAAVAQEEQQKKGPRPEKKFDKTEMVKHRTDETVKQYSLNADQADKLLKLNMEYADKMGPGPRGPRGPHHGGRPGMRPKPEQKPDAETGATPQAPKDGQKRQSRHGEASRTWSPSAQNVGKKTKNRKIIRNLDGIPDFFRTFAQNQMHISS